MFKQTLSITKYLWYPLVNCKRCRHKENHWSVQRKRRTPTMKALEHFDEFYEEVFDDKWPAIRKGLIGKQKYVAVINNYSDSADTIRFLQQKGAINIRSVFDLQKQHIQAECRKTLRDSALKSAWKSTEDLMMPSMIPPGTCALQQSIDEAQPDHSRIIGATMTPVPVHDFVLSTKLRGRTDFLPEPKHAPRTNNEHLKEVEYDIHFPDYLDVLFFEEDNHNEFPQPKMGSTGVLNYYLMDGGSILPVLALDLKPRCTVLDMCAGPGGKSLVALQTLYPDVVRCNDISRARNRRIFNVMDQYLYDFDERWLDTGKLVISNKDGRYLYGDQYDRVLVDVPCTTDRHSLKEDDNNIFRTDRIKERLKLPELQTELLANALKLVKVNGIVVYSTCTLSPIQNEGVVHMALMHLWRETGIKAKVIDLSPALRQFRDVFKFYDLKKMNYGHLVVPDPSQNYGPTYFCKIIRTH